MSESVEECPNCGAPIRNGKCNYCESQQLLRDAWADGKCRNCSAPLRNNLIRDKDNWLVCRYCGWPVKDKPVDDIIKPSTPPQPNDTAPPNSPVARITSSSGHELTSIVIMIMIVMITGALVPQMAKIAANVTSSAPPVQVEPTIVPLSAILIPAAFITGIVLTYMILRNRARRRIVQK